MEYIVGWFEVFIGIFGGDMVGCGVVFGCWFMLGFFIFRVCKLEVDFGSCFGIYII